jgi:hypothetical protein
VFKAAHPAPTGSDLFGGYSPAVTCASAVILVLAICVIDKLTGDDLQIGILHLVPIAMVTWAAGRSWGIGLALAAAALWGLNNPSFYWDAAALLVAFVTVALLVARLRPPREARRARMRGRPAARRRAERHPPLARKLRGHMRRAP